MFLINLKCIYLPDNQVAPIPLAPSLKQNNGSVISFTRSHFLQVWSTTHIFQKFAHTFSTSKLKRVFVFSRNFRNIENPKIESNLISGCQILNLTSVLHKTLPESNLNSHKIQKKYNVYNPVESCKLQLRIYLDIVRCSTSNLYVHNR